MLREDPQLGEALHGVAVIYAQLGKKSQAVDFIEKALTIDPRNATYHNSKGNILAHSDQLRKAIVSYDYAIKIDPHYAVAYNNLGNGFYRQGFYEKAITAYRKAIHLSPDFADAHFNLARLLAQQEDYVHAIQELERVIKLQPYHRKALSQLAHILVFQKKYNAAVNYYRKRLRFNSEDAATQHDCGLAYLKLKQYDAAISHFETTIALAPKHENAQYHLATALLQKGELKQALIHYHQQLNINPNRDTYYNIGVLYMYQERHRDAIDYLSEALKYQPSDIESHLNIAAIYLKLNDQAQAITHYQQALAVDPENKEIQHILMALQGSTTPSNAPKEYISHLFDQYANYYEQHLTIHLQYRVPQLLFQAVDTEANLENPQWRILDLGCGTGLCGEYFKDFAVEMIGVDASAAMLEIATQKGIYNELHHSMIQPYLSVCKQFDLMIAADVFTYIGELDSIFQQVKCALRIGGYFAFTVEATNQAPFTLQQTIRYAHSKNYLNTLITAHQFTIQRFDNIILRQQRNQPVNGYLIVLTR